MPKKLNHHRRILSKKVISRSELIPGMVLEFRYDSKNKFDPKPLVLFLYHDKAVDLIHGINFNYLYEQDVQNIFTLISKTVGVSIEYDIDNNSYSRVKLNPNPKSRSGIGAKKLYERVIKPKLFVTQRTKDCYRTYKASKVSAINSVNYRIDVIEEKIRQQTNLSKNKIKTQELLKNVDEQKITVETDNVRTTTPTEIRKDIQE